MQVFRKLEDVPADFGPTVLSVGNFDGVHKAHQAVLAKVVERARQLGAKAMAVTFFPHPTRVLRPDIAPKLLTLLPEKLALLEKTGLDAVLALPFTRDLSLTKPKDFATQILGKRLKAKEVHEGSNFHFGHKAEGNLDKLREYGKSAGFEVVTYPDLRVGRYMVSSSRVRDVLREGHANRARHLLGRPFSIVSAPGRGRGYGHKYTVPTINLSRYDEMFPKNGVYITRTRINDEVFDAVTNVGVRPTFGEDSFAVESHLLNFHPISLTAQTPVELCFLDRIRDEQKFPTVEALREQIAKDVHQARRYFKHLESYEQSARR